LPSGQSALHALEDALGTHPAEAVFSAALSGTQREKHLRLAEARRRITELEAELARERQKSALALEQSQKDFAAREQRAVEEASRLVVEEQRGLVAATLNAFQVEHDRYFRRVEGEVVRLALAIAAKVLHRETHMDALLLRGAVHAALAQLTDRSGVVLKVAEPDEAAWRDYLARHDELQIAEIAIAAELTRGECTLETRMGTIELGVRTQLEEIERGFFDLLGCRPASHGAVEVEQQ
jgi:flagellar assembly protein FliH